MNFDFSEEQNQLREQARRLLADGLRHARVHLDQGTFDRELWQQIVDMGWPAAAIAEQDGGLGLSPLALCVLAEEIGRSLAPVPFSSSVLQATTALQQLGDDAVARDVLAQLASGEKVATLALAERGSRGLDALPSAQVVNGRINGVKSMVADAPHADFFIVSACGADNAQDYGWFLVDAAAAGVECVPVTCIDRLRSHMDVRFNHSPCQRLGQAGAGARYTESTLDAVAVLVAFEQLGAADAALEIALEYVKTRAAFNRPVASYQAVKHRLADVYVKNQLARSHCYYGAWALTEGRHALPRAAAGARLAAIDALSFAAEESVELHGGIGFTWEGDIQLFYRRARLLASQWGGRDRWAQRLVRALVNERAITANSVAS